MQLLTGLGIVPFLSVLVTFSFYLTDLVTSSQVTDDITPKQKVPGTVSSLNVVKTTGNIRYGKVRYGMVWYGYAGFSPEVSGAFSEFFSSVSSTDIPAEKATAVLA